MCHVVLFCSSGATIFIIGLHKLSSGYTNFHRVMQFQHQVTNFAGENLKYRVTLVPSGAGVVYRGIYMYIDPSGHFVFNEMFCRSTFQPTYSAFKFCSYSHQGCHSIKPFNLDVYMYRTKHCLIYRAIGQLNLDKITKYNKKTKNRPNLDFLDTSPNKDFLFGYSTSTGKKLRIGLMNKEIDFNFDVIRVKIQNLRFKT